MIIEGKDRQKLRSDGKKKKWLHYFSIYFLGQYTDFILPFPRILPHLFVYLLKLTSK